MKNGAPVLQAQKSPREIARELAKGWAESIRKNGLTAWLGVLRASNSQADAVVFGTLVDELRLRGLKIVSSSSSVLNHDANGAVDFLLTAHVETLDGKPLSLVLV